MPAPRRPRTAGTGARRPTAAARRTASAGRSTRTVRAPRPAAPPPRSGSPLTTRAAILGLVVLTLVFSAVIPLKTFLEQRGEIAEMERDQAAARERVAALEHAKAQLEDPAFVAAEARRRLHMARPGEVSYVLIDPQPAPDAVEPEAAEDADAPWWSQVLSSVEEADRGAEQPAADPASGTP